MGISTSFEVFSENFGFQELMTGGSSSLVFDGERGELRRAAAIARPEQAAALKAEKALVALRNHCEAERRRRERIGGHLATLRSLVPGTSKMDKASLLAEVIKSLKELRKNAAEATRGLLVPMDIDEVRVEQHEDGSDGASCAIRASLCCDYRHEILFSIRQAIDDLHLKTTRADIATLGGRMVYAFVITCHEQGNEDDAEACQLLASSIRLALRSVLDKFYCSEEISSRDTLSNKRRRVPTVFDSSNASSLEDFCF